MEDKIIALKRAIDEGIGNGIAKNFDARRHLEMLKEDKKIKLSQKLKGFLSKEQGKSLKKHIEEMRNEWDRGF
jgi:hypothetical protein